MILSVHQPQYIPWLGYFDKISRSDVFVFLDDVQYKKREFQNRNKLRKKNGCLWLTVPVITKGGYYQKINEVKVDNKSHWRADHLKTITHNYASSKYFEKYIEFFEKLYTMDWDLLCPLNVETVNFIMRELDINTAVKFSSELQLSSSSTERIIDICKHFEADTYLSGPGGKDYLDEPLFEKNNIKLKYQEFIHPKYEQVYEGFESYISAVDLLFNCGPDSKKYLESVSGQCQ